MDQEIAHLATRAFGSESRAHRWMKKPCRLFRGRPPQQIMQTPDGRDQVRDALLKIWGGLYR